MPAGQETRIHEAGHAIGALAVGLALHESQALVLSSDTDAWTNVEDPEPASDGSDFNHVRRAVVKLCGPVASLLKRGENISLDEMDRNHKYSEDCREARCWVAVYQRYRGREIIDHKFRDARLVDALSIAEAVVKQNLGALDALTSALEQQHIVTCAAVNDAVKGYSLSCPSIQGLFLEQTLA